MKIKESDNNVKKHLSFYKNVKKRRIILVVIILFLLTLYSSIVFKAGIVAHNSGFASTIKSIILSNYRAPFNYLRGLSAGPVERISVDMKFKDFQKLAYNRKIALSRGHLLADYRDEVPATITYKDRPIKVKLRLKGDMSDHWQDESHWSFRIKVKGENTIFGMKTFSIQHPRTRDYLSEWIFHKILKYCDFIALRYDFIEVVLNGKNMGIYAIEEHFEKRLIENNNYREGVIVRFDDSLWWVDIHRIINNKSYYEVYNEVYTSAPIDAFNSKYYNNDVIYTNQFNIAKNLLESFRRGTLKAHEVFNIKKIAKLFAVIDLFGHHHATSWRDIKFYYNPITSLLEPIGFDNQAILDASVEKLQIENKNQDIWISSFFNDDIFLEEYLQSLEEISRKDFLDGFFNKIEIEYKEKLNILYRGYPSYQFNGKKILYNNQNYIKNILNPLKSINVYYRTSSKTKIELDVGNIQSIPIEIFEVSYQDSIIFAKDKKILLSGKSPLECVSYNNISITIPSKYRFSDLMIKDLKIHYKMLGSNQLKKETVIPWSYLDENWVRSDFIRQSPNINDFNFLSIDEKNKLIKIKSGDWKITHSLHIPEGYIVFAVGSLQIDLINSSKILSYSPIKFFGSEENPIIITSTDTTGQGIFILNTKQKSELEYVYFKNLSNISQNGWELTGAVTFYEADVSINNCMFLNNQKGDDYLNIIRSEFDIKNTLFSDIRADAFDSDFCKGSISNSSFINCCNDAIDISGTNLTIEDIFMDNIGDKGLSAGENSQLIANNIKIINSEIAVCSKDMSEITVSNVHLKNDKIGFTAFQKKSEFGPGNIEGSKVKIVNILIPYLIETHSKCTIDGEIKESNNDRVKDVLYGVKYGKSSK